MMTTFHRLWSETKARLRTGRWLPFALAGTVLVALYGYHYYCCSQSVLVAMPLVSDQSDMFINVNWALSILDQGWLNPHPFHPNFEWMALVGTPDEWTRWWGGEAIFHQAPLYAYFMSFLFRVNDNASLIYLMNTAMGASLCVVIGLIARRMSGESRVGWLAFGLAVLYSPFYAYSWPMLRDVIGWLVTAVLLLLLLESDRWAAGGWKANLLAGLVGLALGVGYMARETFMLIIPLVVAAAVTSAIRRKIYGPLGWMLACLVLAMSPLLIRNAEVGAPLLSSSTRFAEGFIEGNAASAVPNRFVVIRGMRAILLKSNGKALRVVGETLQTHPNVWTFLRLQVAKAVSLLDPFEPCENVNVYFMGYISPPVRWGLPHWMVIVPGLAGLVLGVVRGRRQHFWLWLLLLPILASVLMGPPMSRYRQGLMVLWMPWAAYFLWALWGDCRARRRAAITKTAILVLGWAACLTVFAREPKNRYESSLDYRMAAQLYEKAGDTARAAEMHQLLREKFPGEKP